MRPAVEAVVNYLGPMRERPRYHAQDHSRDNLVLDPRQVAIEDMRDADPASLSQEGFQLVLHRSAVADFHDEEDVERIYLPEIEELVLAVVNADRVVVSGKPLLRFSERSPFSGTLFNSQPARFIHIDISDVTAKDFAARFEGRPFRRFAHFNIWRVLSPPPQDVPLAVCEAGSLDAGDLVEADAVFDARDAPEWSFEGLLLRHNPKHRWRYFRNMTSDEALIFKTNDSDPKEPHHIAHTAFDDPNCPPGIPPRMSVEARAIAYWF